MIFSQHNLSEALVPFVESIFHFKNFQPDHSIERVVPTGHVFLLFELDGFTRNTFDHATLKPNAEFKEVWISGMHKHHLAISAHENSEMLVVQFKAGGAMPFFHRPMHQFNDTVIAADGVFGNEVLHLRSRILRAELTTDKMALAEQWLLDLFERNLTIPKDIQILIKQLQAEPAEKYSEIIKNYPNSQKHMIDQFKKYVGLTPKYYQRILRFNDLLLTIQAKNNINWSDVAYQCGFSDQSHFIKEFQHFSGFNPSEFINQDLQHEPPNFFPLD